MSQLNENNIHSNGDRHPEFSSLRGRTGQHNTGDPVVIYTTGIALVMIPLVILVTVIADSIGNLIGPVMGEIVIIIAPMLNETMVWSTEITTGGIVLVIATHLMGIAMTLHSGTARRNITRVHSGTMRGTITRVRSGTTRGDIMGEDIIINPITIVTMTYIRETVIILEIVSERVDIKKIDIMIGFKQLPVQS